MKPILYFGIVPFHSPRQRPQQLAIQLARHTRVIYVDPPYSVLRAMLKAKTPTPASVDGVDVISSQPVLPWSGYLPLLNRWNYRGIVRDVKKTLSARGIDSLSAVVTCFPKHVDAFRWLDQTPIVYDVMDDYPLFYNAWHGGNLRRMHERALRQADIVTASSRTLAERSRPYAGHVECITNGVDARFVDACDQAKPHGEMQKFNRPRFGYVGTIAWWFDFAVVKQLAEALPQCAVVLIGPIETKVPPLPANVHLLGPKPYAEVPSILKTFDLGLIPFVVSDLINAVNPVKVYEYLAAGLPVAASAFDEMRPFAPIVSICESAADWIAAANKALRQSSTAEIARRRAVATENLWSAKAERFLALISQAQSDAVPSLRLAG